VVSGGVLLVEALCWLVERFFVVIVVICLFLLFSPFVFVFSCSVAFCVASRCNIGLRHDSYGWETSEQRAEHDIKAASYIDRVLIIVGSFITFIVFGSLFMLLALFVLFRYGHFLQILSCSASMTRQATSRAAQPLP
jgi:hypothetical protein